MIPGGFMKFFSSQNLAWLLGRGNVQVEQLGGGLDKFNFAVKSADGFFIWQLSTRKTDRARQAILEKWAWHLNQNGVATRQLVGFHDLSNLSSNFSESAVYRGVSGQSVRWSDYNQTRIKEAVGYLEKIHRAGKTFTARDRLGQFNPRKPESGSLSGSIGHQGYRFDQVALKQMAERLVAEKSPETETVLHGDFGRGNIIFRGETVAGVIDLDRAMVGPPLVDLGRFASYLLLDTDLAPEVVWRLISQTYRFGLITLDDLVLATHWAWWNDWLAWRKVDSPWRERLVDCLIHYKLIEKT